VAILSAAGAYVPAATAATQADTAAAVQKGLAYLSNTQQANGSWSAAGYERAATGAAALALLTEQEKWGDNAAQYQRTLGNAIAYLLNAATTGTVNTRNDGVSVCPGSSASCPGVHWYDLAGAYEVTGFVAPALAEYGRKTGARGTATTQGPLAGMTWSQVAQAITNGLAASQSTGANGNRDGGWRGLPANGTTDSSATEWAILSLIYDESLGAATPAAVKDELKIWVSNEQNAAGAACAQPSTEPCGYAETGSWLLATRFAGFDVTYPPVQAALELLNAYWNSGTENPKYAHFGHPSTMWAVFTGLEATIGLNDATHITNLLAPCQTNSCIWSQDYTGWILKQQKSDGSWTGFPEWPDPIATGFYIAMLGDIQIPLPAQNQTSQSSQSVSPPQNLTASVTRTPTGIATPLAGTQLTIPVPNPSAIRQFVRKGITALAVSPDGNVLAAASSSDNEVRLLNADTGQQSVALAGSLGLPTGLAFSPQGGVLGSVAKDSVLRLWDSNTGKQLAQLSGHEAAIRAIAASPDGRFLATAGEDTRIMLWDLANRSLSKVLVGATDFVNAVAFSPDSRSLAAAGEDARVLIFDVTSGKTVYTLLGHSGPINALAFSPDGTLLASAGQDTTIHLWDPRKGVQLRALAGHSAPIRAIDFSPDGTQLASGGEDSRIILWNASTGAINRSIPGITGLVNALDFTARGAFLAVANDAGNITLLNVVSGVQIRRISVP
jgi:WD40 repeat protein